MDSIDALSRYRYRERRLNKHELKYAPCTEKSSRFCYNLKAILILGPYRL